MLRDRPGTRSARVACPSRLAGLRSHAVPTSDQAGLRFRARSPPAAFRFSLRECSPEGGSAIPDMAEDSAIDLPRRQHKLAGGSRKPREWWACRFLGSCSSHGAGWSGTPTRRCTTWEASGVFRVSVRMWRLIVVWRATSGQCSTERGPSRAGYRASGWSVRAPHPREYVLRVGSCVGVGYDAPTASSG